MFFCILHLTINNIPFEPITTFAQGNLIAQTFWKIQLSPIQVLNFFLNNKMKICENMSFPPNAYNARGIIFCYSCRHYAMGIF